MSKRLPRRINRRFTSEIENRFAESVSAVQCVRRLEFDDFAKRHASDQSPLLTAYVGRLRRCLGANERLSDLRRRTIAARLKEAHGYAVSWPESMRRRRLEKKALRQEAKVALMYEEMYRDVILAGTRTDRNTPERRFFDELATVVNATRDAPDRELHTVGWDPSREILTALAVTDPPFE